MFKVPERCRFLHSITSVTASSAIPYGGVMLHKWHWKAVVNVYGHSLTIFEAKKQAFPPSWSAYNLDVPEPAVCPVIILVKIMVSALNAESVH